MPVHGTIGNILDQIVSGFTNAFFYLFQQIAQAIVGPISDMVAEPLLATMLYTPLPKHCPGGGSVSSCSNPQPALVTQPTNGAWPQIWDLYWGNFFMAAISFGLLLYVMTHFAASIPWVNPQFRERLRGGYLKMLVSLVMGWPVMTMILYIINAMNYLMPPELARFEFLITNVISGMVVAAASPMAILTTTIGSVSITLLALNLAAYVLRIIFMMMVPAMLPLLIMAYSLEIPIGKGLAKSIFSLWVKIGLTPMFVAGALNIATLIMTEPDGSGGYTYAGLESFGGLGVFVNLAMGFVIPIISILGMYFVVQASAPAGASMAAMSAQRNLPSKGAKNYAPSRASNAKQRFENLRSRAVDQNAKRAWGGAKERAAGHDWRQGRRSAPSRFNRAYSGSGGWQPTQSQSPSAGAPAPVTKNQQLAEALEGGGTATGGASSGGGPPATGGNPSGTGARSTHNVGNVLTDNMRQTTSGGSGSTGGGTSSSSFSAEEAREKLQDRRIDQGQGSTMYDASDVDDIKGDIIITDKDPSGESDHINESPSGSEDSASDFHWGGDNI